MKILSIDTSCGRLTVIADTGEKLFVKISDDNGLKKHNALVLEYVDAVLKASETELSDYDAFAGVTGPGSFTGVRVGTATLNAFATALDKPLVSVTAFECVKIAGDETVLIDAGHGCYYYGTFENGALKNSGYAEPKAAAEFSDKILKTSTSPEALALIARDKFVRGETVAQLEPLYLRKSQAEREADERRN